MKEAESQDVYLLQQIRDRLAGDPRTSVLDVKVHIKGRTVTVAGNVETTGRKDAITQVVSEMVPGYDVRNLASVVPLSEPQAPEEMV
jgi:osmotically-inducible protein OsmY